VTLEITGGRADLAAEGANATGRITLHSDGWVKTKVESAGVMQVKLTKETVSVGTELPLRINKLTNIGAATWKTDIDESYLDEMTVTWEAGTGISANYDTDELEDNGVLLLEGDLGVEWNINQTFKLTPTFEYNDVSVTLTDAVTMKVVEGFSSTSATTITSASSADTDGTTGSPYVLTPVQPGTGPDAGKNVLANRPLEVTAWASGDASESYSGTTFTPSPDGTLTNATFAWESSDTLSNGGIAVFNKPGGLTAPDWALASIKFPDTKTGTYTLTLAITADQTDPGSNKTGTITVVNNGWGDTGLDKTFLTGTTGSDLMEATSGDVTVSVTVAGQTVTTVAAADYTLGNTGKLKLDWELNESKSKITNLSTNLLGGDEDTEWGVFTTAPVTADTKITWDGLGDWKNNDKAVFNALATYDSVTVKLEEALSVDFKAPAWAATTYILLTPENVDLEDQPFGFTPLAGTILDLGDVVWQAPAVKDAFLNPYSGTGTASADCPNGVAWAYAWKGYNGTDTPVGDLTVAATSYLEGAEVKITTPTLFPAGDYYVNLEITSGDGGIVDDTITNKNARITLRSNGWVPSELDDMAITLGGSDIEIDGDDLELTVAALAFPGSYAGSWATDISATNIGAATGDTLAVTWAVKVGGVTSTGGADESLVSIDTATAPGKSLLVLDLTGDKWVNDDTIVLTATLTLNGNSANTLDLDVTVTVVEPFGDGTTTAFVPDIDSDDSTDSAPGVFIFTPVNNAGAYVEKEFIVAGWKSGNASASYNATTGATTTANLVSPSYAWTGTNVTFIKPTAVVDDPDGGGPGVPTYHPVPNFALKGIKFESMTPDTYPLTLTINSTATTTGNVTVVNVVNNGWGQNPASPRFTTAFLGDTVSDSATAITGGFTLTTTGSDQVIAITVDPTFDSALTSIGAAELASGDLTLLWTLNAALSTIDGDEPAGSSDLLTVSSEDDGSAISWDESGDWEVGGEMVFDAILTYDGVEVKIENVFTVDVKA
jgi:hypothetical protein